MDKFVACEGCLVCCCWLGEFVLDGHAVGGQHNSIGGGRRDCSLCFRLQSKRQFPAIPLLTHLTFVARIIPGRCY